MAALAASCLENKLFAESVAYYREAIDVHKRTRQRRRTPDDRQLSEYYSSLARAYSGLGDTWEAVEAASGAILCWSQQKNERERAVVALQGVLGQSPDLDAYVAKLDAQVVRTGLENPTVRRALGKVYLERNELDKAMTQLGLALQTQPNDREALDTIVAACVKLGRQQDAIDRIYQATRSAPREIQRYRDLGDRLKTLGDVVEAERAWTSSVEVLPTEYEGHAMLAELREVQERWDEAIRHWRIAAENRTLEPTGLLKLCAAQVRAKRWGDARDTANRVLPRVWPERFGDVHGQARRMLEQIEKGQGK